MRVLLSCFPKSFDIADYFTSARSQFAFVLFDFNFHL